MSVPVFETDDDSPVFGQSENTSLFWYYGNELKLVATGAWQRSSVVAVLKYLFGEALGRSFRWGGPKPHHAK